MSDVYWLGFNASGLSQVTFDATVCREYYGITVTSIIYKWHRDKWHRTKWHSKVKTIYKTHQTPATSITSTLSVADLWPSKEEIWKKRIDVLTSLTIVLAIIVCICTMYLQQMFPGNDTDMYTNKNWILFRKRV